MEKRMKNRLNQQFSLYTHRYKSRKTLLKLNNNQLADIGLTKALAIKEAKRPFWEGSEPMIRIQKLKIIYTENSYESF